MKFRAVIIDTMCIRELLNIINTFARVNKNIVINIQPTKIIFQIDAEADAGQFLWSEIETSERANFFSQFVMDGIDREHNQIYLTAVTANLVRALSFVRGNTVDYVKLKLVKTSIACLTVTMSSSSAHHNDTSVVGDVVQPRVQHDIPVTVVPRSEWKQFELPLDIGYQLSIALPSIKSFRDIVDKKKNLAPSLTVYATRDGELSLVVETDMVTVASHYKNLTCNIPAMAPGIERPIEQDPVQEASCRVDAKKLSSLLESINFCDTAMVGNFRHEQAFNVRFKVREHVFVNFILPAVDFE